jgi:hypothetical protein
MIIRQLVFISILISFTFFVNVNAASVRFYDDNLTLIETRNFESEVTSDFSSVKLTDNVTNWYFAGASISLNKHTITKDINLYSVPLVQEITSEKELDDVIPFLNKVCYNYFH